MTEKNRAERRQAIVHFVWYRVLVDVEAPQADDSRCGIARSCDLSARGLGLFTSRALPAGELVFLEIATSDGNLSAVGKIVHSREVEPGVHRVGIRLLIVPPNDRPTLARILGHAP